MISANCANWPFRLRGLRQRARPPRLLYYFVADELVRNLEVMAAAQAVTMSHHQVGDRAWRGYDRLGDRIEGRRAEHEITAPAMPERPRVDVEGVESRKDSRAELQEELQELQEDFGYFYRLLLQRAILNGYSDRARKRDRRPASPLPPPRAALQPPCGRCRLCRGALEIEAIGIAGLFFDLPPRGLKKVRI